MKKYLASLAVAALAIALAAVSWKVHEGGEAPATPALAIGAPAPGFELADLAGKTYSLAHYRGKVVLLNFWATWCPACREELPDLNKIAAGMKGRDFVLLAPSVDEDGRRALMPFLARTEVDYPVLLCDAKTASAYQIYGLPASFLIAPDGRLVQSYLGPLAPEQVENDILKELPRRNS